MAILSSLPNFSKAAEKLKILLALESYLTSHKRSSMGDALLLAIQSNVKPDLIIASIKSDINMGNSKNVAEVIGEDLTERINNY